ncbi:MAG: hypothetical protein AAB289_16010 [Chloroflexota bacterium]
MTTISAPAINYGALVRRDRLHSAVYTDPAFLSRDAQGGIPTN